MSSTSPVITIDGPSGCGKGTVAQLIADHLQWHMLDSGALYRAVAWAVLQRQVTLEDEALFRDFLQALDICIVNHSDHYEVLCDGVTITDQIRTEEVGMKASEISALPAVRERLLDYQRAQQQAPGLITDGRDMGTVVFPDARVKIFLTADPEERVKRRLNQLKSKGIDVNLRNVREELMQRDAQDAGRDIAPLQPALDAITIDTTHLDIDGVFVAVMAAVNKRL